MCAQLYLSLSDPMDVAARFLCLCDSPGKNTGVGCHFLHQGIFLTQELNHLSCIQFFTTELPEKPWLANDCLIIVSSPGRGRESKLWCFFLKEHESYHKRFILISSVQFSRSVVSNALRPHESQHAMPPCPSPTPGVHSDSGPSSQ